MKRSILLMSYNLRTAAKLMLISLGLVLLNSCEHKSEETNSAYPIFKPFKLQTSYRGGENIEKISDLSALDQAIILYQQERYTSSADKFMEHLQANPDHIMSKFYAGIAFLGCSKPEKAYPLLSGALNDPYSDFKLHAKWYLSIACLETRRLSEARALLLELQADSIQKEYTHRASQILNKHPLLLCSNKNTPIFSVKDNIYVKNDSIDISVELAEKEVYIKASNDAKFLEIHFTEDLDAECMLKLYDERGLLVHMERIPNASSNSVANISLSYKQAGFYNLLIQVGDQKILPFRIQI